jgi:hypothetical protein
MIIIYISFFDVSIDKTTIINNGLTMLYDAY